jgi:hypothetical protein
VRALIASKMLRRRRVRRALLVHLLRSKAESMSEADEGEDDFSEEGGGGEDRELLRALIGSRMLRKRRFRRALLTHLLREKEEAAA